MPRTDPGLDYFPLDVDMDSDDKVELIEAKHGIVGFAVIVRLLMKIYRNSYFYPWSEKEILLFSRRLDVDINCLNAIIEDALEWEIFDRGMFEKWQILTSKGTQKRYLVATKRRRKVEVIAEYLLLTKTCLKEYNNCFIVSINPDNVNIITQSKVKESKVNQSKEDQDLRPNSKSPDITPSSGDENIFDLDTMPLKAALYLRKRILANNPRAVVPKEKPEDKTLQKWALDMDRLNRLGPPGGDAQGYSWDEIRAIIDWCQDDHFWQTNILSASKLREQVVKLEAQMKAGMAKQNREPPAMSNNVRNGLALVEKYEKLEREEGEQP